ncbi:hypothetical protein WJX81_002895 [Elliptochloris bilobata]|uniref:Dynein heavy chain n=1 Tax=Elliptochloris bilobata TaxID=381761 RepID=A0AAW1QVD8_9CHLO
MVHRQKSMRVGPMAEVEFWRARNAVLGGLYEQLSQASARRVLAVVELGSTDRGLLPAFQTLLADLQKVGPPSLTTEARDNLKFLATLERHLGILESGPLPTVLDAIAPLLAALRLVWVISRHYSDDTRMGLLLQRIACRLADRVAASLDVKGLFKLPVDEAGAQLRIAKEVLDTWHTTYMQVRDNIEATGRDARWEFSKAALFERTQHMAEVCACLAGMVETVAGLYQFMGPQLKAVTGDPQCIDAVLARVDSMVALVEGLDYSPLERANAGRWSSVRAHFNGTNEEVKGATRDLINTCFRELRSTEAALELLDSFKLLRTCGIIRQQMLSKSLDILQQFGRELDTITTVFNQHKDKPPVARNQAPVAGAIKWSRSLFARCKRTYVLLNASNHLEWVSSACAVWQIDAKYKNLAYVLMAFENKWYAAWLEPVEATITNHLKQPLLREDPISKKLVVNLGQAVVEAVREARYLDRLGFAVPGVALHAALQASRFRAAVEGLSLMLAAYYTVTGKLNAVERGLLATRVAKLRATLDPALTIQNWHSLVILDFVATVNTAIGEFEVLVQQVQKNASLVEHAIAAISHARACAGPPAGTVLELQELQEHMETHRVKVTDELVKKYRMITPLLRKIEEAVIGTNTGKAPLLLPYYAHWERVVFRAVNTLALNALHALVKQLSTPGSEAADSSSQHAAHPLFKVSLHLNAPEVVVHPSANEIKKALARTARSLVECAKSFKRWMDGTCIETPDLPGPTEDDEPFVHSFYDDVSQNPQIVRAMLAVTHGIQKAASGLARVTEGWKVHQPLWKLDKGTMLDKFKARNPAHAAWEERMARYARIAREVLAQGADFNVAYVRVCAAPLAGAVRKEALAWVAAVSAAMQKGDCLQLQAIQSHIARLDKGLRHTPEALEELKDVLGIVAAVRSGGMARELQYTDLQERFRTRVLYARECGLDDTDLEAEHVSARALPALWHELEELAEEVDTGLHTIKAAFAKQTQEQVAEFQTSTGAFLARLHEHGPGTLAANLPVGLEALHHFQEQMEIMAKQREQLALAEHLFDLGQTFYPALSKAESELKRLASAFDVYAAHMASLRTFSAYLWADTNLTSLEAAAADTNKRLHAIQHLKGQPVFDAVQAAAAEFAAVLPLLHSVRHEALRPRHWTQLIETTGAHLDMNPTSMTLGALLALRLDQHADTVAQVCASALKELTIEVELRKVAELWRSQRFKLHCYTRGGTEDRGWVLKSTDEIMLLLEDVSLNLQSMLSSRFVRPFVDEVRAWELRLGRVGEALAIWLSVQRRWMYLEAIFSSSDDLRQQLPQEAKRFDSIDSAWKKVMAETARNPVVLEACGAEGRLAQLQAQGEQLESCQKSLSEYIELKRCAFTRFYFMSDDELLSVLGTAEPAAIQEHMLKLFDNAAALVFDHGCKAVTGMVSAEGEAFSMRNPVTVAGPVESWMLAVEREMRATLHALTKEGVHGYPSAPRTRWIETSLGMVGLVGSAIWWTWETEDAFKRIGAGEKGALKESSVKLTAQLADLTALVRSPLEENARRKVNTLIITDVHARDLVEGFQHDGVTDARDFAWESQLRFYWDRAADSVAIRQCNGLFMYGYEYMGLNGRLVITALTDRCYCTLTTALAFCLGGAPSGPAGTGKTETVKDLAKSMAIHCVVSNCGEGLDYKAMGSIFCGLVQCGAWGCFDEFNRIEAEVLSVVSSQIQTIQDALKAVSALFLFEGKEVKLEPRMGMFITMNPGYAGRTELPDNLKALFRPVTMVVPDQEQICEIMLLSEGFDTAKALAKKMTVLYKLAREQLSKAFHYDFGLRALKSVLVMAGTVKRASPGMPEALVLMRALRDMNLPKFVYDDVPLFLGLLRDLFPGMDCPRLRYDELSDAAEAELQERGLQVLDQQVDKVVQLHEVLLMRHAAMLIGQTGGGKSVILNALARAQTRMGHRTTLHILDPKAVGVPELHGVLDAETRDWTDGLLPCIFRELNKPLPPGKDEARLLVFDGDVDPVWVENLNSVMDDNHLLTLPNGERIRLQSHCRLLFEVGDLRYASPATISRCGMVFVDARNLGCQPFYDTWLSSRIDPGERATLLRLFGKYGLPAVAFVLGGDDQAQTQTPLKQALPATSLNMVQQLCELLSLLVQESGRIQDPQLLEALYLQACVWSIGAAVVQTQEAPDRDRLDAFLKQRAGLAPASCDSVPIGMLPEQSLYDVFVDESAGAWKAWGTLVQPYVPPSDGCFASILVPTADVVRNSWLLRTAAGGGRACLLVGGSGAGKTAVVQRFVAALDPGADASLGLNFSSQTSSLHLQRALEGVLEKRGKETYGPPLGKRLLLWLDDMNMPQRDLYGTQQPLALLRQLLDRKAGPPLC